MKRNSPPSRRLYYQYRTSTIPSSDNEETSDPALSKAFFKNIKPCSTSPRVQPQTTSTATAIFHARLLPLLCNLPHLSCYIHHTIQGLPSVASARTPIQLITMKFTGILQVFLLFALLSLVSLLLFLQRLGTPLIAFINRVSVLASPLVFLSV